MTPNYPLPVGVPVTPIDNPTPPRRQTYSGKFVTLTPVDAGADAAELYAASHGDPVREQLWTYMSLCGSGGHAKLAGTVPDFY